MKYSHFLLFLLIKTIFAVPDQDVIDGNKYIDLTLDSLRNDPIISRKLIYIRIPDIRERALEGRKIYIKGFSNLRRLNDCIVKTRSNKVNINCQLGLTKLKFKVDYKVNGRPLWTEGKAYGRIDPVNVDCTVIMSPFDGTGVLEKFEVTRFGGFRVTKVRGTTSALNWLTTMIADIMFRHSRRMIIEEIENGISKLLQEKLSEARISSRKLRPTE